MYKIWGCSNTVFVALCPGTNYCCNRTRLDRCVPSPFYVRGTRGTSFFNGV